MRRTDALSELKKRYSCYYDIRDINENDLIFSAEFHSKSERYILVKSAKIWEHDDNEYVFVYSGEILDMENARDRIECSKKTAEEIIDPKNGHRSSDITTVFVYDRIDDDAKRFISGYTYHRSYMLSLHGWTDHRVAAVSLDDGRTICNRLGKAVCRNLIFNEGVE